MKKISFDYWFLFSVLALAGIGLIMVFSASPTMGLRLGDTYYFIKRHIFYLLLGFSALYFGWRLNLEALRNRARIIFAVSLLMLFIVFIPGVGRSLSGAARWIDLGFLTFQPSELMKFSLVLFLSDWLSRQPAKIKNIMSGFLPLLALVGLAAGLIVLQPDLGTAIIIAGAAFILFFIAGAELSHLSALGALGIAAVLGLAVASPYRLRRLLAFMDPWQDPQGIGFHIIQSLLAVGSGGLTGVGLGASRQKFFYLPQQFTDFIFAILCEELGLMGGALVVLLFIVLIGRGLKIAAAAKDPYYTLLAAGLVSWLALQAMINMMVVVGLLPTTGIPLPFISYGGTATILNLFAAGIVLNISCWPQKAAK